MSETSQSLHFWHASREQGRGLLMGCGRSCRIIASNERWTCVVPEDVEALMEIGTATPGIIALWSYVADYYQSNNALQQLIQLNKEMYPGAFAR